MYIKFAEVKAPMARARCKKCGNEWQAKTRPKSCPKCKHVFNQPRTVFRKGRPLAYVRHEDGKMEILA